MPFHKNDMNQIKTKKPIISYFDLLSTNYIEIDFAKVKKSAPSGVSN